MKGKVVRDGMVTCDNGGLCRLYKGFGFAVDKMETIYCSMRMNSLGIAQGMYYFLRIQFQLNVPSCSDSGFVSPGVWTYSENFHFGLSL